ncbi:MAG: L-rhamnose mutarotase [Gammaproteobacteria bacterium]|nr:L-rhamnose mutarotase [Gammaproteobacteria bacterium]MDE0128982.1 L-rhamnose mutarotase [Gammaproteobacteria bacterium]MDE0413609.1 L-rhamnose mutarotase [Gammaproteobacteria bacterium]
MQRMGWIIRIRPEKIAEYKALHANAWPGVLERIRQCSIRNYSIFLREPENLLFGYFEYHGNDFEADMARMDRDEETRRWWKLTDPCQEGLETRAEGEWWAAMEEVFHCD